MGNIIGTGPQMVSLRLDVGSDEKLTDQKSVTSKGNKSSGKATQTTGNNDMIEPMNKFGFLRTQTKLMDAVDERMDTSDSAIIYNPAAAQSSFSKSVLEGNKDTSTSPLTPNLLS